MKKYVITDKKVCMKRLAKTGVPLNKIDLGHSILGIVKLQGVFGYQRFAFLFNDTHEISDRHLFNQRLNQE